MACFNFYMRSMQISRQKAGWKSHPADFLIKTIVPSYKRGCCLTLSLWMVLKHLLSSCLISPLYLLPTEHLLWWGWSCDHSTSVVHRGPPTEVFGWPCPRWAPLTLMGVVWLHVFLLWPSVNRFPVKPWFRLDACLQIEVLSSVYRHTRTQKMLYLQGELYIMWL